MLSRGRAGTPLLARFTVASAMITLAFAIALGWLVGREGARAAVHEAVVTTAQAAEMLLSPYLVKGDFLYPLWPQRIRDLDRLITPHLQDRAIVRLTLWNRDGVAVYSKDPQLVGRQVGASNELRAALEGRTAFSFALLSDKIGGSSGRAYNRLLEVYAPVRVLGGGPPDGALVVARDAEPLFEAIRATRVRVWSLVFLGMVILYGSLFSFVRRASQTLIGQQRALQEAFDGTVQSLAAAVDAKDSDTGGHSTRVATFAEAIARILGLPAEDLQVVRLAGYLHDVGKIGIPDRLLRKPGRLDGGEWATVRRHAAIGYHILEPVPIDERVKLAVRHSHERWDGSGYPDGLAGQAIPIHARILMVADAYEAMTSDRPYRRALSPRQAVAELRRHAGTQFDPAVVHAFLPWLEIPNQGALAPESDGSVELSPTQSPSKGRPKTLRTYGYTRREIEDARGGSVPLLQTVTVIALIALFSSSAAYWAAENRLAAVVPPAPGPSTLHIQRSSPGDRPQAAEPLPATLSVERAPATPRLKGPPVRTTRPAATRPAQPPARYVLVFGRFQHRDLAEAHARLVRSRGYLATVIRAESAYEVTSRAYQAKADAEFWEGILEGIGVEAKTTSYRALNLKSLD